MSQSTNPRTNTRRAKGRLLIRAITILRDRNTSYRLNYSEEEIRQAVEVVRQWQSDHALLRYSERKIGY